MNEGVSATTIFMNDTLPPILADYLRPRLLPGGRWAAVIPLWPGDRGRIVSGPVGSGECDIRDGW